VEALDITERRGPPKPPVHFELTPLVTEAPSPATCPGAGTSLYDHVDRLVIESLDTHAEEVGPRIISSCKLSW